MGWRNEPWSLPREFMQFKKSAKGIATSMVAVIVVIAVIWLVMSSYYTVEANEQAVVLRFGKDAGVRDPGLHLKLPFGIDKVKKIEVKEVKREEFGFRTEQPGVKTIYREETPAQLDEARVLTGDLNILMLNWAVRYRISDIRKYFFELRSPEATIRDVSEAIVRMVVGDSSVDEILTVGRSRIQEEAKQGIQAKLDAYGAGIMVVDVRLKDVTPPDDVKDAFNAVNKATQQKEKIINEAEGERNSRIPEAKGKKQRMIEEAMGYAQKRVNEAEGDAKRFRELYAAYSNAPRVTERRLYLETMKDVLKQVKHKYIVGAPSGDVLKFLNLTGIGTEEGGKR